MMTSFIRVMDLMIQNPVTVKPETPLIKVAQLMRDNSISSVVLIKDNKPYGIVTERDIVWRVNASGLNIESLKAADICSRPVLSIHEEEEINQAIQLMKENNVRRLVIVNTEGVVTGILTSDDISRNVETLSKELALEYIIMSKNIRRH
jgi:predicted transcriptional regulator